MIQGNTFLYRDNQLNKVEVKIKEYESGINSQDPTSTRKLITLNFNDKKEVSLILDISSLQKAAHQIEDLDALDFTNAITQIAKYLILTGKYQNEDLNQFNLSLKPSTTSKNQFQIRIQNKKVFLASTDIDIEIYENKLARRLVLYLLYKLNSEGKTVTDEVLHKEAHFSPFAIENATHALMSDGIVEKINLGDLVLTLKGQRLYEEKSSLYQNKVFIIAACDEKYKDALEVYKRVVRKVGWEPIFQEHQEPQKSIHADIFDYISNVPLIIADLSGHKPNCYIELGYAMALNKRIILTLRKSECEDSETKKSKIAFDTITLRYTFYDENDLHELEEIIYERITNSIAMIEKAQEI